MAFRKIALVALTLAAFSLLNACSKDSNGDWRWGFHENQDKVGATTQGGYMVPTTNATTKP